MIIMIGSVSKCVHAPQTCKYRSLFLIPYFQAYIQFYKCASAQLCVYQQESSFYTDAWRRTKCIVIIIKTSKGTRLNLSYIKLLFIHFWTSSINGGMSLWGITSNLGLLHTGMRETYLSLGWNAYIISWHSRVYILSAAV